MKKVLFALLIAALALATTACNNQPSGAVGDGGGTGDLTATDAPDTSVKETEPPETIPRYEDPDNEPVATFFADFYDSYNSQDYAAFVGCYDYTDEKRAEMLDNYNSNSMFALTKYTFKSSEVLSRSEDGLLMVMVEFESESRLTEESTPSRALETRFYQIKENGDSYLIVTYSPGSYTPLA